MCAIFHSICSGGRRRSVAVENTRTHIFTNAQNLIKINTEHLTMQMRCLNSVQRAAQLNYWHEKWINHNDHKIQCKITGGELNKKPTRQFNKR